jgi:hypothetical protein
MRKLSTDEVLEKHMSWSSICRCEKEEMRQKKIDRNIILCWRHYRESRVTACGWIREVEEQNMIGDRIIMGVFGKVGYKEGWRLEMKLGVP